MRLSCIFGCVFGPAALAAGAVLLACSSFDAQVPATLPDAEADAGETPVEDAAAPADGGSSEAGADAGPPPSFGVACGSSVCTAPGSSCCAAAGRSCIEEDEACEGVRLACDDRGDCAARGLTGHRCCVRMRDPVDVLRDGGHSPVRASICAPECDETYELVTCRPGEPDGCPAGTTCRIEPSVANYGDFRVCY